MKREDAVIALQRIKLARAELQRLMSGEALPCLPPSNGKWTTEMRNAVRGNLTTRFYPVFSPLHELEPGMQAAAAAHAASMQAVVRKNRAALKLVASYNPVQTEMRRTAGLAHAKLDGISNRRNKVEAVQCRPSFPPVDGERKVRDTITVPPMWKRDVYDAGISIAKMGTKEVFIVRAKRKPSAHLASEGIMAWEAYAYAPDGTRFHGEGFVFKSDGDHKVVTFNTDFIRGAGAIKKLIFNAVMQKVAA